MNRTATILAALFIAGATLAQDAPPIPVDPAEAALRAIAEDGIRDVLKDPDSAHFKWGAGHAVTLTNFRAGLFARTIPGDVSFDCGRVNAKNQMGGYVGYKWFWVAIKDGRVVSYDLDSGDDDNAAYNCRRWGL